MTNAILYKKLKKKQKKTEPTSHRSTFYLCLVSHLEELKGAGRVGSATAKVSI
jgi:hypothetical protein